MSKFPRIELQFEQFVAWLKPGELSSAEKRLINLIRGSFDEIAAVGTAGGNKRAKKLDELIQTHGRCVSDALTVNDRLSSSSSFPIKRLLELEVQDFRGFSARDTFKFEKPITLIYGPNGTGKSSFCEALEYSLLGYIEEAEAKRVELAKYIRNSVTGRSEKPVLKAMDNTDRTVVVTALPVEYFFCFIEKNRIDDFARISSFTPADQQNLLSRLFGLEEFNRFVEGFTERIDEYIDTTGKKAEELKKREQSIEKDKSIGSDYSTKLADIEKEKAELAANSALGKSFEELEILLNGKDGRLGRVVEIDNELQNPSTKVISHVTRNELIDKANAASGSLSNYRITDNQYRSSREKVQFKKLFEAVKGVQTLAPDICPACETTIKGGLFGFRRTKKDPYKNALTRLKELEDLAALESRRENLWDAVRKAIEEVIGAVQTRKENARNLGSKQGEILDVAVLKDLPPHDLQRLEKTEGLITKIQNSGSPLDELDIEIAERNDAALNEENRRQRLIVEKGQLAALVSKISRIKTREGVYSETLEKSKTAIENFNETNKQLIAEVEEESTKLEINREYVEAYRSLKQRLTRYKDGLPASMSAGLNDLTKELYNKINAKDPPSEILERIDLPLTNEHYIKVWFKDDPTKEHNALQILSEGHIRCLGLSILLAKVLQEDRKVVVFDDIVNAIDDDHRGGVRELIFSDPAFQGRQIILTTHAEQFIKDLDNEFSMKDYKDMVERITFLYPENRTIRRQETTSNYLSKAESALASLDKTEGLTNCRKALENISKALWTKLSKTYQVSIKVSMRNPKDSPELMSIAEGLLAFSKANVPKEYQREIQLLEYISGIKSTHHNVWNYLNKGTHEESDREEFDEGIVRELFQKLVELDIKVKGGKKVTLPVETPH